MLFSVFKCHAQFLIDFPVFEIIFIGAAFYLWYKNTIIRRILSVLFMIFQFLFAMFLKACSFCAPFTRRFFGYKDQKTDKISKKEKREIRENNVFEEGYVPKKAIEEKLKPKIETTIDKLFNRDKKATETVTEQHRPVINNEQIHYQIPLDLIAQDKNDYSSNDISDNEKDELLQVLKEFGIGGEVVGMKKGPVVTLYEFKPAAGTKSSRVIGLADDIARSMSAMSARIAIIPGKNVLGVELPNKNRQTVYLRSLLQSCDPSIKLPLALGRDIIGDPVVVDLSKMPHLLVAGTTGSGKSVGINAMIMSLLYRFSHEECKFIMIDPKMLELSVYQGIPHLLSPVVTDPKRAVVALKWAVSEMEKRYRNMSQFGVRNIENYNEAIRSGRVIERQVEVGTDDEGNPIIETQTVDGGILPLIVVIVDEMADLMLVAGKEIETAVQRLAQMARAAGIHLIMATQRPSVDVITGTIKANFPTRISFQVTSRIDSRTILGEQGAEQLLGAGDMLYMSTGGRIRRVHGPFVSDGEVENIVSFLKSNFKSNYVLDFPLEELADDKSSNENQDKIYDDPLYNQAIDIVREGKVSISYIQRKLGIGYNRAAKFVEKMEEDGIVTKQNKLGRRDVIM
jgi:S-DNA-T family DNA segregation ATPase FtsK/SpoIIIE